MLEICFVSQQYIHPPTCIKQAIDVDICTATGPHHSNGFREPSIESNISYSALLVYVSETLCTVLVLMTLSMVGFQEDDLKFVHIFNEYVCRHVILSQLQLQVVACIYVYTRKVNIYTASNVIIIIYKSERKKKVNWDKY